MNQGGWPPPPGYGPPPAPAYPMAPYGAGPPIAGWRCQMCGFVGAPWATANISGAGWIVFALLLLFCFPICWLGLMIREKKTQCPGCKHKYLQ